MFNTTFNTMLDWNVLDRLKGKIGFTLIEILVVASIIGMLAAIGFVSYSSLMKNSRDSRRKVDLEQIRAASEMYRSNSPQSSYPSDINAMIPTYIKTIPIDPKTQQPYTYIPTCQGDNCNTYKIQTILEIGGCYEVDPYGSGSCNGGGDLTPTPGGPTPTPGINTPTPSQCQNPNTCYDQNPCCPGYTCAIVGGQGRCAIVPGQ